MPEKTVKVTVPNSFELHFNPRSQELTLICAETSEGGRVFELAFDRPASFSMFERIQGFALGKATEDRHCEELTTQLERGPLLAYEIDPPMEVFSDNSTGAITIDCPCLEIGGINRAGVLRLRLTPLAAQSLKRALDMLQTTPGEPAATGVARSSH
jgi:hypothetical protein